MSGKDIFALKDTSIIQDTVIEYNIQDNFLHAVKDIDVPDIENIEHERYRKLAIKKYNK